MENTGTVQEQPTQIMLTTDNPLLDIALKGNERKKRIQNVLYSVPMKIAATGILLSSLFAATFLVAYQTTQKSNAKASFNEVPKAEIVIPLEISRAPKESLNQFCGGIAGLSCPDGYMCKLDGDYPDASGTCTPEEAKPIDTETPVAP
jgi:hypothetical protein